MRHSVAAALVASLFATAPPAEAEAALIVPATPVSRADTGFDAFKQGFVDALLAHDPDWALQVGSYRDASRLAIPDPAADLSFAQKWLGQLARHPVGQLSEANRIDRALIENRLRSLQWYSGQFRNREWDPSQWNVGEGFSILLTREYAPLEARLLAVSARLAQVPAYYTAAARALRRPTLEHTQLAIEQSQGVLALLDSPLASAIEAAHLDAERAAELRSRASLAREAVHTWVAHLEALMPRLQRGEGRSFRIGPAQYARKFAYDIQTDLTPTQLYRAALTEKERLHAKMDTLAAALWPRYFPDTPPPKTRLARIGTLIEKLSEQHVAAPDFVAEVQRQIPQLEAWVRDKDLLTLNPDKPLQVRETPLHKRGVAGASIDAPGPFDPAAITWYNVDPLDALPATEQESTLREYNRWTLQILNIHEAVPGHYAQLVYANRSPSMVKSLLGNGAMIEGWAVYAERMMLESGWGDHEPEMELIYAKWVLRVVCNTILDYSAHTLGMSEAQAMTLLREEAFQQEAEAREKWRRVQLTQVQLASYYSGFESIYALREDLRRRDGDAFDLKTFHERFLGFGSAPVKYIRQMMLG
ncbi:DUF885 domain-containing protein [Niveibacterium umoris]|uniref:Uncharacterized protein (DUF885 family) n=2 Tax=Niveibacterium umoris TaxID=1193620 RepID=A0A840BV66_9RHOO|nr:DUF885 domain-containing protein [Niveibacterium umoris]MBB4014227.1 uncharacterized protein (DUF885 family) [Niveibacterium umoris]